MSVRITVQSGLNDSARTQILVEDERGAFLFDCGAPSWSDSLPQLDGALISHAHSRHTAGIPYLPQDTPIYASVMTSAILKAMQGISQPARENETVFAVPGGYDGPVASRQAVQRPYTFLLTQNDSANPQGEPIDTFADVHRWWLGNMASVGVNSIMSRPASVLPQVAPNAVNGRALQHYPVDHSILGASATAIETRDGWIGYTGDIRFHGQQPGLMEEFVQGFMDLKPLALIVDGSNTQPGVSPTTENDVYERVMEVTTGQNGLIVADFDAMDMERLLTFNHVAEATRRSLVLSPRDVHMYLSMSIVWRQFPAFDAVDAFRILDAPQLDDSTNGWEADLRDQFQAILVSPDELRKNGRDYIVRSSPAELGVLEAEEPTRGVYIRSRAATGNEDVVLNRVRDMGLDIAGRDAEDPNYFHSSGHATFDETIAMIRRIVPRYLIPVHTAQFEAFTDALERLPINVVTERGHSVDIA